MQLVFNPEKWTDFSLDAEIPENKIYVGIRKTGKPFYFMKSARWGEHGFAEIKPGAKATSVEALKTLPVYYCSGEEFGVRVKLLSQD
ncbi:MAG: hypothetical protein AAGA46_00385 [Cyanobacteria bacterium P01_F01_bin.13]